MSVAGYFDQHMRQNLFTAWCNHMQQAHIQFKSDIARIEVSLQFTCHPLCVDIFSNSSFPVFVAML